MASSNGVTLHREYSSIDSRGPHSEHPEKTRRYDKDDPRKHKYEGKRSLSEMLAGSNNSISLLRENSVNTQQQQSSNKSQPNSDQT